MLWPCIISFALNSLNFLYSTSPEQSNVCVRDRQLRLLRVPFMEFRVVLKSNWSFGGLRHNARISYFAIYLFAFPLFLTFDLLRSGPASGTKRGTHTSICHVPCATPSLTLYSDYRSTICKAEEQNLCRNLRNTQVFASGVSPTLNTKKVLFVRRSYYG